MNDTVRGTIEMSAAMAILGTIGWFVVLSGQPIMDVVFWRCAFGALTLLIICAGLGLLRDGLSLRVIGFATLGGVAIVVSDTGIGIPQDKLEVVTLPFEQVGSEFTRNHEGSGLGLAITKDLIEMHGGTLDIDSEVGVGTIVTVLLPDKVAKEEPRRQAPVREKAAS